MFTISARICCQQPRQLQNCRRAVEPAFCTHTTFIRRTKLISLRQPITCQGVGKGSKDAVGGAVEAWFDFAGFVSSGGSSKTPYSDLAYQIGKDVYVEINGWHLYLRDISMSPEVKLSDALAQKLGEQLSETGYKAADVEQLLHQVPLTLGKGKQQVPLFDTIPTACIRDLQRIVEDFYRDL